ncbi:MAG: nucleoside kinase, partial [Lachnospiraceae bacterium]
MAKVEISGKVYEYDYGTSFEQIARDVQADYDSTIILCVANGKIRELHRNVEGDCKLSMITLKDSAGHKTYERSATMIF